MATLTQVRRDQFPARYARKDARRAIYNAIYEPSNKLQPSQRQRRADYNQQHAAETFLNHWDVAEFPANTLASLCDLLKIKL